MNALNALKEQTTYNTLIVDDDPVALLLLERILISRQHRVTKCSNAEDAFEAYKQEKFPLIISDWVLPNMDGLELCRQIRQMSDGDLSVILVITGKESTHDLKHVLNAGADDYLNKPINQKQMNIRIEIAENLVRDKLKRKIALTSLKESEKRYALSAKAANDGLWDWNLLENIVYYSPRWKYLLGYDEGEIADGPEEWFSRLYAEDLPGLQEEIQAHLDGKCHYLSYECRMRNKNGDYQWILIRGIAERDNNRPYRMVGSISDITKRKMAEEQVIKDAFYDLMTGLPNHRLFLDRLSLALVRAKRHKDYLVAVLFLDIDKLKNINNSLGHQLGNKAIIEIGQRLEQCVRGGDTVARMGGDEFLILLDDLKSYKAGISIVERIMQSMTKPIKLQDHDMVITTCIGMAINSASRQENAEDLVRHAHIALNSAKDAGKNNFQQFKSEMNRDVLERLNLENRLYTALQNNELMVYYQPQINARTGRVIGFETLLRWLHPQKGMVSPVQFIPVAEETGYIVQIGEWVLRSACKQVKKWQDTFQQPLVVAVNFSARQFKEDNLVAIIKEALSESGLAADSLELEITESIVMDNIDLTIEKLKTIKELGVNISIDDFGTGYSSLSYLKQLPLDILKIDQSFVRGIPSEPDNVAITNAIIALAKSLGMAVTAEGVENEQQQKFLLESGCDKFQGYLFYRPCPASEIPAILEKQAFAYKT